MFKTLKESRGFTLIELMVVIVILSLLAVLVGPKIIGRSDDAKIADAKVQIRNLETALKLYKLDSGNFPTTDQGLQALLDVSRDPDDGWVADAPEILTFARLALAANEATRRDCPLWLVG